MRNQIFVYYREMQLTTIFFVLLIYFVNITMSITVIEDQCSCSCCIGLGCNPIQKPDLSIPWCVDDDAACVTLCKMIFPADCNHIDSQTFAVCLSKASKILNQYTSLNILGLISIIIIQWYYFKPC